MFKKLLALLIIFIFSHLTFTEYCYSNESLIDSLEQMLPNKTKVEKADIYLQISQELTPSNQEKSISYAFKAINIFENEKDVIKVALGYSVIGEAYSYMGNFNTSFSYYQKALSIYKTKKDEDGIANTYNAIGINCFYYQNNYDSAITFYQMALSDVDGSYVSQAKSYNYLGSAFRSKNDLKKALENYTKALQISEKAKNKKLMAQSLGNIGLVYYDLGEYSKSIEQYQIAGKLRDEIGDLMGSGITFNNIGNVYQQIGKYNDAILMYQQSLKIFEKINYPKGISSCLGNIGLMYQLLNNNESAIEYHQKALDARLKDGNKKDIASSYINIGIVKSYIARDKFIALYGNNWESEIFKNLTSAKIFSDYSESYDNFNKALKISEEINDLAGIAQALVNIGTIYNYSGLFSKALSSYERSLSISKEQKNESEIATNLFAIGNNYLKLENYKKAEEYLNQSEILAKKLGLKEVLKNIYETYSLLYERTGKYAEALKKYKDYAETKDILTGKEIAETNSRFESANQKQQIELLNKDKALKDAQIKQQRWAIAIFIFVFILIVFVIITIVRQYNEKKKANAVLAQKNDELAQKNDLITHQKKEITDSIHYAQRIQAAILPQADFIKRELPEHFILFKPRDIVSGDFYWMYEKNGKIYVITADCTGHGVPGAFMSMLGTSLLNQIIAEADNLQANEILNRLRKQIIKSLHQTGREGENKDGMDLVFYILDKANNSIQFAGANNPLIIVRNGELIELKADKMPIGIHERVDSSFTNNEFQLEKGDCLYSFSDGYPDQFGGPTGKKFMVKQLKQILVDIYKKPLSEQHTILDNAIVNWMTDVQQIDDILMIGVRV